MICFIPRIQESCFAVFFKKDSVGREQRMEYYCENVETEKGIPARIFFGGRVEDRLRYPMHWHSNLEFNLVLEGCIRGRAGNKEMEVHPGEIFFANSGELHETDATGKPAIRSVSVLLSDTLLREYCPDLDAYYFSFEKGSDQEKKLAGLILECAKLYEKKERFYELELAIAFRKMCCVLLKECMQEKSSGFYTENEYRNVRKVKKSIAYIEEHYENPISVKEMGELMGMTPTYFSRFFRKSTGQTFHHYLTYIRLEHARQKLEQSDDGITEIAYASGFPNVKSLIEAFKKEYGITPAKYRRDIILQRTAVKI